MQRTLTSASLVALLLALAASASAGTPDDPELTDANLDAGPGNPWADIEKAWIEEVDAETLRVYVQVALMPPTTMPGTVYALIFTAGDTTYYAALVHADALYYGYGEFDLDNMQESGFEPSAGAFSSGPGGRVAVDFPRSVLDENVTTLTNIVALTVDIKAALADGPYVPLDRGDASRDFTMTARPAPAQAPNSSDDASADQARQDAATAAGVEETETPPPAAGDTRATPAPSLLLVLAAGIGGVLVKARKAAR